MFNCQAQLNREAVYQGATATLVVNRHGEAAVPDAPGSRSDFGLRGVG